MADWPTPQDTNCITITTASPESCGWELSVGNRINGEAASAYQNANSAHFVPFLVYAPCTAQMMLIHNGGTLSGNVDVGVYDDQGNRLVSMGSTAQAGAAAIQTFDITDTLLEPGLFYMALAMDNITGLVGRYGSSAVENRCAGMLTMASAFPLPATATMVGTSGSTFFPLIGVALRSFV